MERGGGRSLTARWEAAYEKWAKLDCTTVQVAHLAGFIGTQAQNAVEDLEKYSGLRCGSEIPLSSTINCIV